MVAAGKEAKNGHRMQAWGDEGLNQEGMEVGEVEKENVLAVKCHMQVR